MSDGSISIKLATAVDEVAPSSTATLISNDGFFPDISLTHFREQMRLDGTVTNARLQDAMIEAIASVNDELADYQTLHSDYGELSNIPASIIHHESVLVYRYRRAVYCLALANLYERYGSFDTTNDGEKKMELLKSSIDELRRDARFAISDMLKTRRIDAELI